MASDVRSEVVSAAKNNKNKWYLASSKPRQEFRAIEQLANQGIDAFCPTIKIEKITRGKKQIATEALFSGYLFIKLTQDDPLWHKVRSTIGVRDWVRFAGNIAQIPTRLVEGLIETQSKPENEIIISQFNQGQSVRILTGPFSGLKGIFDKQDGELRSMILIEFLGQKSRLKVNNEQIITD